MRTSKKRRLRKFPPTSLYLRLHLSITKWHATRKRSRKNIRRKTTTTTRNLHIRGVKKHSLRRKNRLPSSIWRFKNVNAKLTNQKNFWKKKRYKRFFIYINFSLYIYIKKIFIYNIFLILFSRR